jgi:hypothetical protein
MSKSFVQIENDFSISSDPSLGAQNVQQNGSQFTVVFNPPISVPREAKNVRVSVERATTWFTYPSISANQGNNLFVYYDFGTRYELTIPDGLYSLDQLEQTIIDLGTNAGIVNTPNPFIQLTGNEATQKVNITFGYNSGLLVPPDGTTGPPDQKTGVIFEPGTPYEILGWNLNDRVIAPVAPTDPLTIQFPAPNVAGFNTVNEVLLKSDLVSEGIPINNKFSGVLTPIQIDVPPGSQQVYQPFRPLYCSGESLKNSNRTNVKFFLTDEEGNPLDTAGEYFTATIRLSYLMPISMEN